MISKTFFSNGTYVTHMNSQKHKDNFKLKQNQGKNQMDLISLTSTTSHIRTSSMQDIAVCLFCDSKLQDEEMCLEHMFKEHGFFIRERDSLVDLEGLIKCLAYEININFTCLHCNLRFKDYLATQQHMRDKGHCFMPKQEYQELSMHYDHSSKLEKLILNPKLSISELEEEDDLDDQSQFEEAGDGGFIKLNLTEVQKQRNRALQRQLKTIKEQKADQTSQGEVILPGGKIIGVRSLRKYYKQCHIPFQLEKQNVLTDCQRQETQDNDSTQQGEGIIVEA